MYLLMLEPQSEPSWAFSMLSASCLSETASPKPLAEMPLTGSWSFKPANFT